MDVIGFLTGYLVFAGAATVNWIQTSAGQTLDFGRARGWVVGYRALSWAMLLGSFAGLALTHQAHYVQQRDAGAFFLWALAWGLLSTGSVWLSRALFSRAQAQSSGAASV